jgi:DNA-binding response OmpR family regulator
MPIRERNREGFQSGPGLVVLHLMLPRLDGFEVCRILRRDSTAPILMLTVIDGVDDDRYAHGVLAREVWNPSLAYMGNAR